MCNNSPCTCTGVGGFWVAPQSSALIILLFLGESNGTGPGLALFAECFSGVGTFSADRLRRRAIAISLCRVRALILLARVQATLHYTAPFEGGQGVVVVMVDGIWVDRRSLYERVCMGMDVYSCRLHGTSSSSSLLWVNFGVPHIVADFSEHRRRAGAVM